MNADTRELICEGRCNPGLPAVDRAVERYWKYTEEPVGAADLWTRQRRLTYTPHAMVSWTKARCVACGAERTYGSVAWG